MPTANDGLFKRKLGSDTKTSGVWDIVKLDNMTQKLETLTAENEDMTANVKALSPLPAKVENLTANFEALIPMTNMVEALTTKLENMTVENVHLAAIVKSQSASLEDLTTKFQTLVEKLANGMYFKYLP